MKILKIFKSRKYFQRILITNTLIVVLFLIVFSSVLYYYSKNKALELQQDASRKILNQVNYNIDNLNETVKNLTFSTYYQSDITVLMNNKDIEIFEKYNKLRSLENIAAANPYVQSIIIYNNYNKCYYSTLSFAETCDIQNSKNLLQDYLNDNQPVPKLKLVPLKTDPKSGSTNTFSFFMYASLEKYIKGESVLMVNIKSQWLFDNINTINELSDNSLGTVFIMDLKGEIFSTNKQMIPEDGIRKEIYQKISSNSRASDYFILNENNNKKIVTYITSKVNDWRVVSIQPYNTVFGKINQIGTFSMIALGFFLLLSIIVSWLASTKLYKPLGSLVNQIKQMPQSEANGFLEGKADELFFISTMYKQFNEKLNQLTVDQNRNEKIVQNYYLRRLLTDSFMVSYEEFKEHIQEHRLNISSDGMFLVAVLKIDNFKEFNDGKKEPEKKLIKFAIQNIMEEILSKKCSCQSVDMRNDQIAVLISLNGTDDDSDWIPLFEEIQKTLYSYYYISLTAAISDPVHSYKEISKSYEQALQYSSYRIIFGKMEIITPNSIKENINNMDLHIPMDVERKLIEGIKANDIRNIEALLIENFKYMSRFSYDSVIYSILNLTMVVNKTIREMNSNKVHLISIDLKIFNQSVLEKETIDEVFMSFMQLFQKISEQTHTVKEEKNDFLMESIKEMVEENYLDQNLSLQSISLKMRMSSVYIGRIFKRSESISVAEYINEVRLRHALNLLENKDFSILEIMKLVGFSNESNFFKLFKKKTGTTPNEYRMRKHL